MPNLLDGVRVVESAVLLNGDTVGMLLGDLGADVIKVESPPVGDYLRYFLGQIVPGVSVPHAQVNRNKRSVLLNLSDDSDRETFWRLIDTADIFVDGNRPGVCEKLGVGPDAMRARKPSLVYVQHTGFGAVGPYANIPTHGMLMNALVGAHAVRRGEDGLLERGSFEQDGANMGGEATSVGALHAALHAVAALYRARQTGLGAYIDVAGSDATAMTAWIALALQRNDHRITDRSGMATRSDGEMKGSRYQFYETADGRIALFGCIEQRFWDKWAAAAGREDLVGRQADTSNGSVDWGDDVERHLVAEVIATKTLDEWLALAAEHGFALGAAHQSIEEVAADPHIAGRNVFVEGEHPVAGPISYVGSAAIVDGEPFVVRRHAPAPGEHTEEVLAELAGDRG
ncbi:CoA transferase [Mycolicibacterium anyangense]|uniref:CoA transferase n=1 Tax=Mycolicibacterium anyangense TaxID=1431246 RepID=A0A6N4WIR2_9MYCO|nr:CoA transferase [Mycolicibacterium anyangense]BBZ79772.1 CoA transferase [Mycolicibacterium anyangense]